MSEHELVSTNEKFAAVNKQLISFNEQIKQHDITQANIITTTAHELKTLTHAILGYSELLQMDFEQDNDNPPTELPDLETRLH